MKCRSSCLMTQLVPAQETVSHSMKDTVEQEKPLDWDTKDYISSHSFTIDWW